MIKPLILKNILNISAQYKLDALRRIRNYLTVDKAKLLVNAFIDGHFNYAPVIWMFRHKTTYLKIQKNHHKTLKVIYRSGASYDDLLQLRYSVSHHQQHLRFLWKEIYKSNPIFMWSYFKYREVHITWDGVQYFSFHLQGLQFMVIALPIFLGL